MIVVYIFGGLLLLLLLQTLIMPREFEVVRTARINCSAGALMAFVGDFHNYSNWNPWLQRDETVALEITGTPGQEGHLLQWKGKKIGAGSMVISYINPKSIGWQIRYIKPWKANASDVWNISNQASDSCTLSWTHKGELPWPVARLMGGFIRKNLTHQFEQAMRNLQQKQYT